MLREIHKTLADDKLHQLHYALQNDEPMFVDLGDGFFIGVCINEGAQFHILESHNNWVYGRLTYAGDRGQA